MGAGSSKPKSKPIEKPKPVKISVKDGKQIEKSNTEDIKVSSKEKNLSQKIIIPDNKPVKVETNNQEIQNEIENESKDVKISKDIISSIQEDDDSKLTDNDKEKVKNLSNSQVKKIKEIPKVIKKPIKEEISLEYQETLYENLVSHVSNLNKKINVRIVMRNDKSDANSNVRVDAKNPDKAIIFNENGFLNDKEILEIKNLINNLANSNQTFVHYKWDSLHPPDNNTTINIIEDSNTRKSNNVSYVIIEIKDCIFQSTNWNFQLKGKGNMLVISYYSSSFYNLLKYTKENKFFNIESMENTQSNSSYFIYSVILLIILIIGGVLYYKN